MNQLLPSFQVDESDSLEGHSNIGGNDSLPNGHSKVSSDTGKWAQGVSNPFFPKVDDLLSLFKNSCTQLVDLRTQVYSS